MDYPHQRRNYLPASAPPRAGLILLDLNMPKMDGREALPEIKSGPPLRQIPVAVMTTSKASDDNFHCYDSGAGSFIIKPITFESLIGLKKGLGHYGFDIVELPSQKELRK